jgi:hypothetical protein
MKRRAVFIAAVSSGVVVLTLWSVVALEPFKHEETSFEVPKACSPDAIVKGPRSSTLSSKWENGALVIRATESAYCSDSVQQVSAQVIGALVFLRIKYDSPHPPTACYCEHASIIRLSKLPQRDYKVMRIGTASMDSTRRDLEMNIRTGDK